MQVTPLKEKGSSSKLIAFEDDLVNDLVDTFFQSMRLCLDAVMRGRNTPIPTLKKPLLLQIDGMQALDDSANLDPLRALVEKFGQDIDAWCALK